jgi:hypothetical protein
MFADSKLFFSAISTPLRDNLPASGSKTQERVVDAHEKLAQETGELAEKRPRQPRSGRLQFLRFTTPHVMNLCLAWVCYTAYVRVAGTCYVRGGLFLSPICPTKNPPHYAKRTLVRQADRQTGNRHAPRWKA